MVTFFHSLVSKKGLMSFRFLFVFLFSFCCISAFADENDVEIPKMIEKHEKLNGIPRGILKSIATVESGIRPYVVNIKGKSYIFESKKKALNFIQQQIKKHNQNFSVGCMQIHYKSHKNQFNSVDEMLSPERNLAYAAFMLKKLYTKYGNWEKAIKRYHAAKAKYSNVYYKKVMKVYNSLNV